MRKFIKKFKNSITGNILKIIWKVLWWIIEALIIFIALVIVTQRFTNNQKAFLGFRIFSVATGSMEPQYAVGDVLISREKEPSEIQVGEDIVYLGAVADYKGKIITHKVIEKEQNEAGEYLFHTKGIANNVEDPVVHEDQLYGVIFYNNEILAFLCKILTNKYGLYFFIILPIILTFFIGLVRNQGERIEKEKELERERREKQRRRVQKQREAEIIEEIQDEEERIEPVEGKRKTVKKVEEQEETKNTRKTVTPKKKVESEENKTRRKTSTTKRGVEQEEPVKENKQTTRKTSTTKKAVEQEEPVKENRQTTRKATTTKKKEANEEGTSKVKKTTRTKKEKEE